MQGCGDPAIWTGTIRFLMPDGSPTNGRETAVRCGYHMPPDKRHTVDALVAILEDFWPDRANSYLEGLAEFLASRGVGFEMAHDDPRLDPTMADPQERSR